MSVLHLISTIIYLSTPQSQCLEEKAVVENVNEYYAQDFYQGFKKRKLQRHKTGLGHFWINRRLLKIFEYFFALCTSGEFEELIRSKIRNKNYSHEVAVREGTKWTISLGEAMIKFRNLVMPLWPYLELEPCEKLNHPSCLHIFTQTYRVVFNYQLQNCTLKQRNQHHLDKGHALLNMALDEMVTLNHIERNRLSSVETIANKKTLQYTNLLNEKEAMYSERINEKDVVIRKLEEEKSEKNTIICKLEEEKKKLLEKKDELYNRLLEERDRLLEERNRLLEERNRLLEERNRLLKERNRIIRDKDEIIHEKDRIIEELQKTIEEKNKIIDEKDKIIEEQGIAMNKLLLRHPFGLFK